MSGGFHNDQKTIYVQYCRSCDTHNWCTHHDQAKYHDTFLKFSEMITKRLPNLEVIGNMVPQHLIPFKIAENKYIDANTNKYVVYPHIGAFEVIFQGRHIFSKKDSHTWPNLPSIISKICNIIDPTYQSPRKPEQKMEEDKQTSKLSNNNSFLDSEEDKKTKYKTQQKGFTLTDHFKLYRPKNHFEQKDWLTQKQQSEASQRQISEAGRLQKREKSNKSLQSKKSSDLMGQSKLKQMLRSKGALSKEQGKKEMIIRLDSIEEQNVYEEAAQATQRTQDKNSNKKNRMKQIDEQINSLEDKFKKFQNRVHDIQTKNMQFEQKTGNFDDKNKFKQIIENKSQLSRNLSTKKQRESEGKQKIFADKTNKLQQYLTYSEQQKNDKLHRIYGQWKLIKQFPNKNKKLIKPKERTQEQEDSASQSSKPDSHSQSPSSYANIITFKHKNQRAIQKKIHNLKNRKEHKYSSMERYNKGSSQFMRDIKTHTDDNFYKPKFFKNKPQIQSDGDIHTSHGISKLIKKSFNTLSANTLKAMNNSQSMPRIKNDPISAEHFSSNAKTNINNINNRISNIQQKIKNLHGNNFEPIQENPYNRSRQFSKSRTNSNSSQHVSLKKVDRIYNPKNQRNSNLSNNNTIRKSQQKGKISNFSEVARPQTKKINEKQEQILQEQQKHIKPHQSKRKQARYAEQNEEIISNEHSQLNKLKLKGDQRVAMPNVRQKKLLKQITHKKIEKSKITNKGKQFTRKQSEKYYEKEQQMQEQKYFEPYPHQARQAKSKERKHKDWKESSPTKNILRSKEIQRRQQSKNISQKIRQSDSKQTVMRNKKSKPNKNIIHKQQRQQDTTERAQKSLNGQIKQQKARSGQIRKNKIIPKYSIHKQAKKSKSKGKNNLINQQQTYSGDHHDYNMQNSQEVDLEKYSQQIDDESENNDQYYPPSQSKQTNRLHSEASENITQVAENKLRKTLGYFKANDLCFRGAKTSEGDRPGKLQTLRREENQTSFCETRQQNEQYESQSNPSEEKENEQDANHKQDKKIDRSERSSESEFVPRCKQPKKNNQQLEKEEQQQGWKNKSESYENDELPQKSQEIEIQRKNSLERELQKSNLEQQKMRSKEDKVYEVKTENVVKQTQDIEQSRPLTTNQVCKTQSKQMTQQAINREESTIKNQSQKVPQPINKQAQQNCHKEQEQKEASKQQQVLKEKKKQMRQKKQKGKKKQKKQKIKKQQITKQQQKLIQIEVDIQKETCNAYSDYLIYKISTDLSKPHKQAIKQGQTEIDCQPNSVVNQAQVQQIEQIKFINFEPAKSAVEPFPTQNFSCAKQDNQNQIDNEQMQSSEESQSAEDEEYADQFQQVNESNKKVDESPTHLQQINKNKSPSLQESSLNPNILTNQLEVQQLPLTLKDQQENKSTKNEQTNKEVKQINKQKNITVLQQVHPNQQKTQDQIKCQRNNQTSNVTPCINTTSILTKQQPKFENPITNTQQPTKSIVEDKFVNSAKPESKKPQQDNVYSEVKKPTPSKYVEMGVQKEMTHQISIQTDSPNSDDTVILPNKNSIFARRQVTNSLKTPQNRQLQQVNALSQFEGTVRNNFISERKNLLSQSKSKRQLLRARITNQIFSNNRQQQMQKFIKATISQPKDYITQNKVKLQTIYKQGIFINQRSLEVELIQTKFTKYLKVLQILAQRGDWIITRLFEDYKGIYQQKSFGVWLCKDFKWECFIEDDCVQVDQFGQPFTYHTGNQKWVNVLEKSLASAYGGYEPFSRAQTGDIFTLLTGCNSISVKIKQDPSKNGKLLQLINQCQRKNYIVHAEKHLDRMKVDQNRQSIYYVLSVRRSTSDQDTLLQISQDGRESFWIKLTKFTQEFSKIEILQLRVNHNFTHIDLGVGKQNKTTVVELNFTQSGQGCVTLSYINHIAPLSAYLYREQKSKVLKLVGQAKQKQKSHLFFECNFNEGKYYVFAQTKDEQARLCYTGQNTPSLKITEQIHNDGLKNEVAEYLPVKQNKQSRVKKADMQSTWNDWKGKTPRLKDNFVESRLRQNFVEYILGKTKHRDAQF